MEQNVCIVPTLLPDMLTMRLAVVYAETSEATLGRAARNGRLPSYGIADTRADGRAGGRERIRFHRYFRKPELRAWAEAGSPTRALPPPEPVQADLLPPAVATDASFHARLANAMDAQVQMIGDLLGRVENLQADMLALKKQWT